MGGQAINIMEGGGGGWTVQEIFFLFVSSFEGHGYSKIGCNEQVAFCSGGY